MSKINSSLRKLSGDPKTTSSVMEPVQRASTPGITPLKLVLVGLDPRRADAHFAHCVLIEQVQDSREVESVDDWI